MAANAMGAVALRFHPDASRPVAGDSTAIETTVAGWQTGDAVIPGRAQVGQLSGVERGARASGLVVLAILGAAALAPGPIRHRAAGRHGRSLPPVTLPGRSAPRRGPPPVQFV